MSTAVSISARIDRIIARIEKVKVFEHHWTLIGKNLTRLRRELNEAGKKKDGTHREKKISQTIQAIEQVAINCCGDQSASKGIVDRELESLLFRLQLRLAQLQANLTDDYQAKVNILSDTYHDQQLLVQKIYDEKMKRRLEEIEQRTTEQMKEELGQLRTKHTKTIESYLRCCMELHKSVPLSSLKGEVVGRVAKIFYGLSSEAQIEFEQKWQGCELPLTRTFIQLRSDKSTAFERVESRRLLNGPETNLFQDQDNKRQVANGLSQQLVSAPYMLSMVERGQCVQQEEKEEENVSEEDVLRTKRWIVILGEPGSGKTSFARWLVHHLAEKLLSNRQNSTDFDSLRIPILIRVREFVELLSKSSSLTLFEYIGKHTWMGKTNADDQSISLDSLSSAIQDYIEQGQALIILDGLDEIPISDQRSKVINIVENFVETYVQTPTGRSVFDNLHLSRYFDNPSQSGGNQLIITTRIVGYHAAPLAGQFAHYTIRPMDMDHMKDFVDYWFYSVHQQIIDMLNLSKGNQGKNHGETLKQELQKEENANLLDMASNSCLMSFICSVAFSQSKGSPLPSRRIELYQDIVDSMLNSWSSKGSTVSISKLILILSDIAIYIHQNSTSGLIHEDKMKEICIESIKAFLIGKLYSAEDLCVIENQTNELVRISREDVEILAARGESLYGFLHLTFQEYFICLKLIDVDQLKHEKLALPESSSEHKVHLVTQSLRRHMNDPRFRVPNALALGRISSCWLPNDFDDFCREFIQAKDESESLLPIGAFMLITYANDLAHYPSNNILFDALDQLIIAAGQHQWSIICPFLVDRIVIALRKLRNDTVPLWINNLLSQSPPHSIQTISALCYLLEGKPGEFENIHWLDQSSCSILQSFSTLDNENNQFAIDRLLVKISFSNHRLLSVHPNSLKEFLITQKIELHSIPAFLFPLIITLYGGLKRDNQSIVFDPFHMYRESTAVTQILIRFLSIKDRNKNDKNLINIKEDFKEALLTRIEIDDQSSETVDLCIATICLYGIDFVRKTDKIISNGFFNMSVSRFKYVSMILRQFYFASDENDRSIENEATTFISTLIKIVNLDQSSKKLFISLIDSLRSGMARLRSSTRSILLKGESKPAKRVTLNLSNSLRKESQFFMRLLSTDIQFDCGRNSCSLLHNFIRLFWILEHDHMFDTPYRVAVALDDIQQYLLFHNDEDFLFPFIFVPQHLNNLYFQLLKQEFIIIDSKGSKTDDKEYLCFSHILVECLMALSNASCNGFSLLGALTALLPMLRMHQLDNFGSSLLWTLPKKFSYFLQGFEAHRKFSMDYETGLYLDKIDNFPPGDDMSDEERRTLVQACINQEHKRLRNSLIEHDERSINLYSACVSLACICRWAQDDRKLHLLEESVRGAMSIESKLVRLDALSVILLYSHSDCHRIQASNGRSLQKEIEHQFNEIFPDLPILLHTAIFIRCLPLLQRQDTIENWRKSLLHKLTDADQQDQQIVYEALSPYMQSNSSFVPFQQHTLNDLTKENNVDHNNTMNSKSFILRECFTMDPYESVLNESLSLSLLLSNMYLVELANELHGYIGTNEHLLYVSNTDASTRDETIIIMKLFQLKSPILTVAQASTITDLLSSNLASNRWKYSKKFWAILNNALHRLHLVEFKACRLIECWMRWKESAELSLFAFHAALLLAQSDFWSVEVATIVCDLLCCENDRFRQKAEMILRSRSDYDCRTSSKLDIDVLLTLTKKMANFQHTSPFAKLTLSRMFNHITIDTQSHLETFLWLERYRIYALISKKTSLNKVNTSPISQYTTYFPTDITIDVSFCGQIRNISGDLLQFMCDLIPSNLSSFLDIDGDITSKLILKSHIRFVVSVLVSLATLSAYDDETRPLRVDALITLLETSRNNAICQAAAYALGYILDEETYKKLFIKLKILVKKGINKTSNDSSYLISALISSYCHYMAVCKIDFDKDDIDLFRQLLKNSSEIILKTVHIGLARVLKEKSMFFEMVGSDDIQCYHALIGSTAYFFAYDVQQRCAENTAEFIEEHPHLLPIFIVELYNSIRHFTKDVVYRETTDNILAYGYPQYVEVASLIAVQMPAAFISCIKDCGYEDNLKRSLSYTSKQHDFSRRSACLTILSVFGELTVQLCEMLIESLCHDLHIQNTCYKCLTRIKSIKDENAVRNLLFICLKSKSMNIRYAATQMLLHFSQSSLIPFDQVLPAFNELMSDPTSEEDLWLIEEQEDILTECTYYCAGPLKNVIYSLLVQHLIGDASRVVQRNELNDIDWDFLQCEKASRLAACFYEEKKEEENLKIEKPSKPSSLIDDEGNSTSHHPSPTHGKPDDDEKPSTHEEQGCDDHVQLFENEKEPVEKVAINNDVKKKIENKDIESSIVGVDSYPSQPASRLSIAPKKKSTLCVLL
ncbi:unnamed protein product [Rotaria sp. Silwood2]|nr:unnamed protein product [Rotaria sp. Silwood2]